MGTDFTRRGLGTDFTRRGFLKALGVGVAGTVAVATAKAETPAPSPPLLPPEPPPDVEPRGAPLPTGYGKGQRIIVENNRGQRRTINAHQFEIHQWQDPIEVTMDGSFGGIADTERKWIPGLIHQDVKLTTFDPMFMEDELLVVPMSDCEYVVPIRFERMDIVTEELDALTTYECFATVRGKVIRTS